MTQYTITAPRQLHTTVTLPASKSISNRALIIPALTGGHLPQNLSDCDDTTVMISALKALASHPAVERTAPLTLDIKAAGTAMRFLTAYLAATPQSGTCLLTGTPRMQQRPIGVLVDALRHLGADITYTAKEGFPPLLISGAPLAGGVLEVEGGISSQYISALLLIGPMLRQGLTLRLTSEVISRPYIDLTLWMMREFGADAEWTSVDTIEVRPQPYRAHTSYYIENDWSAASYWYEMVALSPDPDVRVQLVGLMDGSKQGDSSVRYIFSLLGVKSTFKSRQPGVPTTVVLRKSGHRVSRLEYDFVNAPDLAQTIVATCCALNIPFRFTGLQTLKIKETNRINALKTELGKLGYVVRDVDGRELVWDGATTQELPNSPTPPLGRRTLATNGTQELPNSSTTQLLNSSTPSIDTYNDHRMALAFAPLSLLRPIAINDPLVVTKSYPHFWDDLHKAGFSVDNS